MNSHQLSNCWLLKWLNGAVKFIGKYEMFMVPHVSAKKNVYKWANSLKEGRSSVEDEDRLGATVSDWLKHHFKKSYAEGIRMLVQRLEKCVTVLGEYLEK